MSHAQEEESNRVCGPCLEAMEERMLLDGSALWGLSDWMSHIDNSMYLSEMTIPGTHDTMASTENVTDLHSYDSAGACQTWTLREQLDNGIRYIDIRGHLEKDGTLTVHHAYMRLADMSDVFDTLKQFLQDHPTETIVMEIKSEDNDSTSDFVEAFAAYVEENADLFWTKDGVRPDEIPTLGEARGKVVLLRRFAECGTNIGGIDAGAWGDNDISEWTNESGVSFYVQDHYKIYDNDKYSGYVEPTLNAAKTGDSMTWYINFTSAAYGLLPATYAWGYHDVASEKVNQLIDDYVSGLETPIRLGTVVLNYPEFVTTRAWGQKGKEGNLVEHIVMLNRPAVVWVDDDYNSNTPNWGATRFSSINTALAAVSEEGKVVIYSGEYAEPAGVKVSGLTFEFEAGGTTINANVSFTDATVDASEADLTITGTLTLAGGSFTSNPNQVLSAAGFVLDLSNPGAFDRYTGTGTEGDPYVIFDVYALQGLAWLANDAGADVHFLLGSDIDASATSAWPNKFEPIAEFSSSLDGHGWTISGLHVSCAKCAGMIADLSGSVTSLGLTNAHVVSTAEHAGILAAVCSGSVSYSWSSGSVGSSTFAAEGAALGGLVGVLSGTITDSYSTATVTVSTSEEFAGGLVGDLRSGGLIKDCYAAGHVSAIALSGELVGPGQTGTVENSYYDSDVSPGVGGRGTPKTTAEMRQQATFSDWDFTNVWSIDEGNSYPTIPEDPNDIEPVAGFGEALKMVADGFMNCGTGASISLFTEFTVEAWVKLDDAAADQVIVSKWGGGSISNYYVLGVDNGHLRGQMAIQGSVVDFSAGTVVSGQWTHLAITFSLGAGIGAVRGYVDGDLVYENTRFTVLPLSVISSNPLCIGALSSNPGSRQMIGKVDEVRIWKVERSQADIREGMYRTIYDPLTPETTEFDDLVGYWQFDQLAAPLLIRDVSRGGNNGFLMSPLDFLVSSMSMPTFVTDENVLDVSGTVFASDPDRDVLSFRVEQDPAHGHLVFVGQTGKFTYTPDRDWTGTDSFTFSVSDDGGSTWSTQTRTVTVQVNPVEQPSVAGFGGALDLPVQQNSGDPVNYLTATPSLADLDAWTFSAWIKPLSDGVLYSECDGNGIERLGFEIENGKLAMLAYADDGTEYAYEFGAVTMGEWNAVSVVFDGTTVTGYVNGQNVSGGDFDPPTAVVTYAVIGDDSSAVYGESFSWAYQGLMDEIRLWNVAKTGSEVRAQMNQPLVGDEANLVAYWRFDETAGTSFWDASSFGKRAVAHGSASRVESTIPVIVSRAEAGTDATGQLFGARDFDLDVLTFAVADAPAHGQVVITDQVTGTYAYTPDAGWSGDDSFTFKVSGDGGTTWSANTWSVALTIEPAGLPRAGFGETVFFDGGHTDTTGFVGQNVNWTFQARIKPDAMQAGVIYAEGSESDESKLKIALTADGALEVSVRAESWESVTSASGVLTAGQWHEIAVVYEDNAQSVTLYVDGVAYTGSAQLELPTSFGVIGDNLEGDKPFIGAVDEVSLWNAVRTKSQITQSMKTTLAGDETGLLAYWPLDEGFGATTRDGRVSATDTGTFSGGYYWLDSTIPLRYTLEEDGTFTGGTLFGFDADHQSLTFEVSTDTPHGRVTIYSGDLFKYVPLLNWNGSDTFYFRASNDGGATWSWNAYPITLTTQAVNDAPVTGFGEALMLDGQDDCVKIASTLNNVADWTFQALVKPTSSAGGTIYSEGDPYSTLDIRVTSDLRLQVRVWNADHPGYWMTFETSADVLTVDEWNTVTVSLENGAVGSGDLTVIVNGHSFTGTLQAESNAQTVYGTIGQTTGATRGGDQTSCPLAGQIDEVRIWTVGVSDIDSLLLDQTRTLSGLEQDLGAYWRFDEATGSRAWDASEHWNEGELVNGAAWTVSTVPVRYVTDENVTIIQQFFGADVEHDPLHYRVSEPEHGTLSLPYSQTAQFNYMPDFYYSGSDAFSFRALDTWDATSSHAYEVAITVNAVNQAPVAGFGDAIWFAGTGRVEVAATLNEVSNWTFEAWLMPTLPVDGCIYSEGNPDATLTIELTSQGAIVVSTWYDGTWTSISTEDYAVPVGLWTHLAVVMVTFGGISTLRIFAGDTVAIGQVLIEKCSSTSYATIGANTGSTHGGTQFPDLFQGLLDEVRIWNIARDPDDIVQTTHTTLAGDETGLVSYWRMDVEDIVWDATGQGNDGLAVGYPRWGHPSVPIPLACNEDQSASGKAFGADVESDTLTFRAASQPSHGTVTLDASTGYYTYTPGYNYNGSDSFTFAVSQNDGQTWSADDYPVTVTVNELNDAPSFTGGDDQVSQQGADEQTVAGWATGISPGPADEGGQQTAFHASTDNDALFAVLPAISPDGTLTFTPAAGAIGVATVSVYLQDDGGTDNGGQDTSAVQTFTITVGHLVNLDARGMYRFTDVDGDLVLVRLSGGGTGTLYFPTQGNSDLSKIVLTGTTERSMLVIAGRTSLGGIECDGPLGRVVARTTDLSGTVTIGPAASATATTMLLFANITDANIQSAMPISTFLASSWQDSDATPDTLTAPWASTIVSRGDFGADVNLTGAGATGNSVNVFYCLGSLDGADLAFAGAAGTIMGNAWTVGSLTALRAATVMIRGNMGANVTMTGQNTAGTSLNMLYAMGDVAGSVLNLAGAAGVIYAGSWTGGSIQALYIGSLLTTRGAFSADVNLTGANAAGNSLNLLS
ncbi:MAG TPA: phosphatidylinositol-specific phospholipase C domain-containing protein, partial [Phycisphaerae bacterium]|nr:phosphatidylinositol-specific phospholipase C domain-containing protein [Phycisphaerae bacterium]